MKTMIGLALVAAILEAQAGAPAADAAYGPFQVVGRVSAPSEAAKAPIEALVNAGLASTADGGWLRWKLIWRDGRPVALEQIEALPPGAPPPSGWNLPARRPAAPAAAEVAGETGCLAIGAAVTVRGRIAAWNCDSAPGTLLGRSASGRPGRVEARLPARYQAMAAEVVPHGGVSRVILAAYDPRQGCFDYLELGVRP